MLSRTFPKKNECLQALGSTMFLVSKAQKFDEWLRKRLQERGQGQKPLALEADVSASLVSRWASGEIVPGPPNLVKIADFYNEDRATVLRVAHPELAEVIDAEAARIAADGKAGPHDCWERTGLQEVRHLGKLDEGHIAALESYELFRLGRKVPEYADMMMAGAALAGLQSPQFSRWKAAFLNSFQRWCRANPETAAK